MILSFFVLL